LHLFAMVATDVRFVCPDEVSVADDLVAAYQQPVDPVRPAEDERRDGIVCACELEPLGRPDRDIRAPSALDRADVVTAENRCAAARCEPERLAHGHGVRPAEPAGDEQRLLGLEGEVSALV
jgi:hypothetical protein